MCVQLNSRNVDMRDIICVDGDLVARPIYEIASTEYSLNGNAYIVSYDGIMVISYIFYI